ncbi:MAG: FkbM family methyltransferase [Chitinophagaceae bacterium]
MKKVAANIVKGFFGKLQSAKKPQKDFQLNWFHQKIIKHQDDEEVKQFTFKNGIIYYQRPYELLHTFDALFVKGMYHFHTTDPSPLIIDCGSNIGVSILYFKNLFPLSKIISFEPDENNFRLLSLNVEKNNLSNVEVNKEAVWIKKGAISFESNATEGSHITEENQGHTNKVTAIRLADLLQQHSKIHFLKIDIEGAEWAVVKDCAHDLHRVENLFLEYHGKANETFKLAEIIDIIKETGFSVYIKMAADNLKKPFLQKTTSELYDVQLNLFCYR